MEKISPILMAQIYWNRLHLSSINEVQQILKYFKDSIETTRYWNQVLDSLNRRN